MGPIEVGLPMMPRGSRALPILALPILLSLAVAHGQQNVPAPETTLSEARQCLKDGDYDKAAEILRTAIRDSSAIGDRLGEAYLLLVNTHVQRGNSYKDQPHGRATAELWYREARQTIEECLALQRLYHLRPIPREDYPPEMISLFEGVRADLFGDFRVVDLDPPDAVVVLEGDTLRATCDSCSLELRDLPKGPKTVRVARPGYSTHTEAVMISPNSMLERSFSLAKDRGPWWYALRVGSAASVIVGYFVFTGDKGKGDGQPEILPEPPPPPGSNAR